MTTMLYAIALCLTVDLFPIDPLPTLPPRSTGPLFVLDESRAMPARPAQPLFTLASDRPPARTYAEGHALSTTQGRPLIVLVDCPSADYRHATAKHPEAIVCQGHLVDGFSAPGVWAFDEQAKCTIRPAGAPPLEQPTKPVQRQAQPVTEVVYPAARYECSNGRCRIVRQRVR